MNECINYLSIYNEKKLLGDCCVSFNNVVKCRLDEPISTAIAHIIDKCFCHIPVLDCHDNHVVGVFTISTLMRIAYDGVPSTVTLDRIQGYFCENQYEDFPFVSESASVASVLEYWKRAQEDGKHIGMFLVTKNGSKNEPLRGIFTEWDFAKASKCIDITLLGKE